MKQLLTVGLVASGLSTSLMANSLVEVSGKKFTLNTGEQSESSCVLKVHVKDLVGLGGISLGHELASIVEGALEEYMFERSRQKGQGVPLSIQECAEAAKKALGKTTAEVKTTKMIRLGKKNHHFQKMPIIDKVDFTHKTGLADVNSDYDELIVGKSGIKKVNKDGNSNEKIFELGSRELLPAKRASQEIEVSGSVKLK